MAEPVIPTSERNFKPPNVPAAFTGTLWRNKDGSLSATITDVFNTPIHLIMTKEDDTYFIRGWRGVVPEIIRIPLLDDGGASGTE